jgi:hypothetical protein
MNGSPLDHQEVTHLHLDCQEENRGSAGSNSNVADLLFAQIDAQRMNTRHSPLEEKNSGMMKRVSPANAG